MSARVKQSPRVVKPPARFAPRNFYLRSRSARLRWLTTKARAHGKRHERYYSRGDPRRATGRLIIGAVVGLATALVLSGHHGPAVRAVAGWDAGAITLLSLVWWVILASNQHDTQCRAAAADPGRTVAWLLVIMASSFSIFAGTYVMRHARDIEPQRSDSLIFLSLVAVVVAWLLTHTSYTLRYAHLYYRDD